MEHLLRLSGLLGEKEQGKTDLSVLEQRLAQRTAASDQGSPASHSESRLPNPPPTQGSQRGSPRPTHTPSSRASSPASVKKEKECSSSDVDDLAEMMDSLVTNNHGETRYIGEQESSHISIPI